MLNYPLTLTFKILTIAQQVSVLDATGRLVLHVKQKAFKLKEDVVICADEAQTQQVYRIRADRILDISARYSITTPDGQVVGAIQRQGLKSFWRSSYLIFDAAGNQLGQIVEENPWLKVADQIVGEIPLVGFVAQKFINPAYLVQVPAEQTVLRLQKTPSFIDRRFEIRQVGAFAPELESVLIPAVMMMILMERQRG